VTCAEAEAAIVIRSRSTIATLSPICLARVDFIEFPRRRVIDAPRRRGSRRRPPPRNLCPRTLAPMRVLSNDVTVTLRCQARSAASSRLLALGCERRTEGSAWSRSGAGYFDGEGDGWQGRWRAGTGRMRNRRQVIVEGGLYFGATAGAGIGCGLGVASVSPSAHRMASKYICCTLRRSHVSFEWANDPKNTRPLP